VKGTNSDIENSLTVTKAREVFSYQEAIM